MSRLKTGSEPRVAISEPEPPQPPQEPPQEPPQVPPQETEPPRVAEPVVTEVATTPCVAYPNHSARSCVQEAIYESVGHM